MIYFKTQLRLETSYNCTNLFSWPFFSILHQVQLMVSFYCVYRQRFSRCNVKTVGRYSPVILNGSHKVALLFHTHSGREVGGALAQNGVSTGASKIRKTAGLSSACGSWYAQVSRRANKHCLLLLFNALKTVTTMVNIHVIFCLGITSKYLNV